MKHLKTFELIKRVAEAGSIRRAAEENFIAPSALHRRIQAFEDELGLQIFERLQNGVRLNAAGELVIHHIRKQIADAESLKSTLSELEGIRRGHVTIACSQALAPYFLPRQISLYRKDYPRVTFKVVILENNFAAKAIEDFDVDMALVFDSDILSGFRLSFVVHQPLRAVVARSHPLAQRKTVRLRECVEYPLALPDISFSGRRILDASILDKSVKLLPDIESNSFEFLKNYTQYDNAVCLQIDIGLPPNNAESGMVKLEIDRRDLMSGYLYLAQHKGRNISVAAAKFAEQINKSILEKYDVAI